MISLTDIINKSLLTISVIILSRDNIYKILESCDVFDKEYDFIIIGAGSSGSVLASRLSEVPNFKVLLIEAGGAQSVVTDMPAMTDQTKGSSYDWFFKTVPQEVSAYAYYNRQIPIIRGKGIGGTSIVNNMNYFRGFPEDFDNYAFICNTTEWSWKNVFQYYLKAEKNTDPLFIANGYHSDNGTTNCITPPSNLLLDTFINATIEFGYPKIYDLNDPKSKNGAAIPQKNIKNGVRQTVATVYLEPIYNNRHNLNILAHSYVTKIIFDKKHEKAIGVKFYKNKNFHTVYAKKEIILSAGTYNSAKLLMLSGIGPKYELLKYNITLIKNLPVGQNYIDICAVLDAVLFTANDQIYTKSIFSFNDYNDFFVHGKGPLTFLSYASLRYKESDDEFGQIRPWKSRAATREWSKRFYNFRTDVWDAVYNNYTGKASFAIGIINQSPYSRGSITLNSNNPFDPPKINPRFLTDKRDLDLIVRKMEFAYKLVRTKAFEKINAQPFKSVVPMCKQYYHPWNLTPPKKYLKCIAKSFIDTLDDPMASCKMGHVNDSNAVVYPDLKVRGVKGLRVIDSSVMPAPFSGHTHTACVMIGEKMSDVIKHEWIINN